MVDRHERHVPHQRQRLGRAHARRAASRRARGRRWRDRVDVRRRSTPASTSASATTGVSSSTWARLAISGTTPPIAGVQIDLAATPPTTARRCRRPRPPPPSRRTTSRCRGSTSRLGQVASPRPVARRGSTMVPPGIGASMAVEPLRVLGACRRRGPTSRARPRWSRRSSPCARRRARSRTAGTAPAPPSLVARTSSVRLLAPAAIASPGAGATQQAGADLAAVPLRVDRDGRDVAVVDREQQAGVADDGRADPGDQVDAAACAWPARS